MKKILLITVALMLMSSWVLAGDKDFVKVDKMPEVKTLVKAEYPKNLKKAGEEGTVMIKALVLKDGSVKTAEVSKSSGYKEFDESALQAAEKSAFNPATQDGAPVAVWVSYSVTFALEQKDSGK